jgi:geranylgeranyl diphosphate synthase type I
MTPLDDLGPDFPAVLARVSSAVEERLGALWAERLASLQRYGAEVTAMASAARDLTLRGGKRDRAALLAAAYAGVAPAAPIEPALRAGVALELLQTYLLIQNDWMDRDDTRLGGASVHAALAARLGGAHLGAASALLASDFAWNLAFDVLASIELPPPRVVAAIRLFTRIHQDVVVGRQIDLLGRAEDAEAMHARKTGSNTVRGPLLLGAALAGAPAATLDALERYAAPVGAAFQLRDDLLGTSGPTEETGKRLAGLCREAEELAAGLPVTPAARGWLAGAAAALAPKPS